MPPSKTATTCPKSRPRTAVKNLYFKAYIKLADGSYVYSSLKYYNAKMYVTNKLSDSSAGEDLKALCVALMNYGAAAQTYFNVEGNLMNADLTDYQSLAAATAVYSYYAKLYLSNN